ncbi:MAG: hypothetical protein IKU80_06265 [Firmicutes bacterium]|nr:hypothetical protein [Bacillota bacterium]
MSLILTVLKVLGIIILILLAVLLLILMLVLFVPVRYSLEGEKRADIKGRASVTWLFKVLNITAEFVDGDLKYKVKALWKVLAESEEEEIAEESSEEAEETKGEETSVKEVKFDGESAEKTEIDKAQIEKAEDEAKILAEESKEKTRKLAEEERKRFEEYKQSRKKAVVRRVKMKDIEISEEVSENTAEGAEKDENKADENECVVQKIDKDYFLKMPWEEKKSLAKYALKLIKRILKGVLPKDFYLDAKVGTGDPSTTGYVLAAAGVVKGMAFKNVNVAADFEKVFFEGSGKIKGKITIGYLLYSAICFALAKPVRKIIKLYLKGRGVKK